MKFTEKTIHQLEEIGLVPEVVFEQGPLRSTDYHKGFVHVVETGGSCAIKINVYYMGKITTNHTIRYETLKALKLAEQAEEIIKENGK